MKTYRFRLYPTVEPERLLKNQIELCRQLYNSFLLERRYAYRGTEKVSYVQPSGNWDT